MAAAYPQYDGDEEMGGGDEEYPEEIPDPRYAQVTDEGGRIESVHSEMGAEENIPASTTVDKKEEKRLEKERREQEKREKEETKRKLKEQEKQIKEEAKKLKASSTPRKKERVEKQSAAAAAKPSPKRPVVKPKRTIPCRVRLLDGTDYEFELERGARGSLLVEMVCEHLNLLERDYFSCSYDDNGVRFWLLKDRRVSKQIRNRPWVFDFGVKFYPPEPTTLQEDITRYLLCLQVRGDILCGKLPCSNVTNALLGSYVTQSELGDYDAAEFGAGYEYLRELNFCPNQNDELLAKIAQLHPTLRDQTPAEAELNYLTNAVKLELYGIELQSAKDAEMVNIYVGVSYAGLCVYRDNVRINRFPWPVILKMSYKKRNFFMKIRPAERETFITTLAFMMPSHSLAKRFWRLAIEHHSFFRLKAPMPVDRGVFARFGSSRHRFSGRTYYQSHTWAASITRPPPYFERLGSRTNTLQSVGSSYPTRTKSSEEFEDDRNRSRQYDADESQVAFVAGTAPAASRVAYVKTVQSTGTTDAEMSGAVSAGYQDTSFKDTSYNAGYRPKVAAAGGDNDVVVRTDVSNEQSFDDDEWNESSFSHSVEVTSSHAAGPPVPKKKKKKTVTMTTTQHYTYNDGEGVGNVVTEYKSEKNGVVETKVERRAVMGRQDIDHDMELSKAINSVMDMNADLSVDKIEINPTDVAHSMVGPSGTQPKIEIKTKKSKKHAVISE